MTSDISKLRPELLEISDSEFERRQAEMELARRERDKRKAEAEAAAIAETLRDKYDELLSTLNLYREHGKLPPAVVQALSNSDGTFAPHQKIKKPRV